MPKYSIKGPGDKTYSIEGPEGATREQVIEKIKEQLASEPQEPAGMGDFLKGTFTDVLPAMGKSLQESGQTIGQGLLAPKGEQGVLQGTFETGKALGEIPAAIPRALFAGAGALGGHPMAAAEHAVGKVIAPTIAATDDPQEMFQKASSDIQTALSALGSRGGIPKGMMASAQEAKGIPTSEQLRAAYKADYEISEKSGVEFKPQSVRDFKNKVVVDTEESGRYDPILAPKAFQVFSKLEGRTTVPKIDNIRKLLGEVAGSPDKYERAAATHFIERIDEFMKDVPHLSEARANYAAREKYLLIMRAIKSAERKKGRQGSGFNLDNSLRQELSKIREKKPRGFAPEQLDEMDRIIDGSWTGDTLRWIGNLMAPRDFLHLGAGAYLGHAMAGPVGAVSVPVAGMGAKKIADMMTMGRIKKLGEQVRMTSPLAKKEEEVRKFLESQGLQ